MKIEEISYSDAVLFWEETINPVLYTHPAILSKLSHKVSWYAFVKGSHLKCLWPLCWNKSGQIEAPPFTYWVGPIWSNSRANIAQHSHLAEEKDVYEAYIKFFEENGFFVNFEFSITNHDVRIFDWWNFTKDKKSEFEITPKYTAQIDLKNFQISQLRGSRKRQIRDFDSSFFNMSRGTPPAEDVIDLYEKGVGASVSSDIRLGINSLIEIADQGFGSYLSVYDRQTEELCGFSLTLSSKNQTNLVLNLSSLDSKKAGLHAWLTLTEIQSAGLAGKYIFDFNGANSPKRGDDKHSYGSSYKLYFSLRQKPFSRNVGTSESMG